MPQGWWISRSGYDPLLIWWHGKRFWNQQPLGMPFPGWMKKAPHAHELGDHAVEQHSLPWPCPLNSGLGPVFSNVSCISCHHNDGKGNPTAGLVNSSLLMRLSIPGVDEHGGPPGIMVRWTITGCRFQGRVPEAKNEYNLYRTDHCFPMVLWQ